MEEIINILEHTDHGEDFYLLAIDKISGNIIAFILEIPNIFDQWQNKEISATDIDTVIIDLKYRHLDLFPWMFDNIVKKLRKRGVKKQIGVAVWSKNTIALKCFLKVSKPIGKFRIYKKKLKKR